jgi:ribosomal-protein-alanine N-acetyltransferase
MTTQPPDIAIRRMRLEDIPQVHAIDVVSFPLPWPEHSYRFELLQNEGSRQWVAETDQRVVGMIVVWLVIDEAHVATIAVHPDYRGHGIGRRLLAEALIEAIEAGAKSATLEVREHNTVAQQLYLDFKFEVINRRKKYYTNNHEDAIIMSVTGLDAAYLEWLRRQV